MVDIKYRKKIEETIQVESILLGPLVSLMVAKTIPEIRLGQDVNVAAVTGDLKAVLEKLVACYVGLAGESVKIPLADIL